MFQRRIFGAPSLYEEEEEDGHRQEGINIADTDLPPFYLGRRRGAVSMGRINLLRAVLFTRLGQYLVLKNSLRGTF